MQLEFALDYIPRRMKEMGYEDNYIVRWRHFQMDKTSTYHIDADNEYYLLIDPDANVSVRSKFGVYDMTDAGIDEMQYEHRGKIDITNNNNTTTMILFLQIIPSHKK
ncbi:MAG TPA: hypothetical protein VN698_06165 [Bacteroidia bacterium]|nr:hypothetical protein [Bacteroidia bacterium]